MAARNPDGTAAVLRCTRAITLDTQLHVKHGTSLEWRGLRWMVTDQKIREPLIRRPVLENLGLDYRGILTATAFSLNGVYNASRILEQGIE